MKHNEELLLLTFFLAQLIFPSPLFFIFATFYLTKRTTPFEQKGDSLAYGISLHIILAILAGLLSAFIWWNSVGISIVVLAVCLLAGTFVKKVPQKGSLKKVAVLLAAVVLLYSMSNFAPGQPVEGGVFVPFIYAADGWFHMSVAHEIYNGIFPPENPHLSGDSLVYYWLSHLYIATMAKVMGIDFLTAFRIFPLFVVASVTAGAFLLARRFFAEAHWPAALAVTAGPLAAYFLGVGGKLLAFPYVDVLSIFHPQAMGLALFFLTLAFFIQSFEEKRAIWYAAAFAAFLPAVHLLTFFITVACMAVVFLFRNWTVESKMNYKHYAILLASTLAPLVIGKLYGLLTAFAVWAATIYRTIRIRTGAISQWHTLIPIAVAFVASAFYLIPAMTSVSYGEDYIAEEGTTKYSTPSYFVPEFYSAYIGTYGFPGIVLLIAIPFLLWKYKERAVRLPLLLLLFTLGIGVLSKLPLLAGENLPFKIMIAGRRFINLSPIFVSFLAYFFLREKKPRWVKPFVLLAALPTLAAVLLMTFWSLPYGPGPFTIPTAEMESYDWIRQNTPVDAVFAIQPQLVLESDVLLLGTSGTKKTHNHPLPSYTGRRVVVGSDEYSSLFNPTVGFDGIRERLAGMDTLYNGSDMERSDVIRKYGIDYIHVGWLENKSRSFENICTPAFSNGDVQVWRCER